MPLLDLRVILDKPSATYEPGETVHGEISFSLPKPKIIKPAEEIRLEVYGKAKCHWSERRSTKDNNGRTHYETIHHQSKEHYVNLSVRLVDSMTGHYETPLPTGLHSYPFAFQLPVDIPCSYEHKYGYIRYVAKAIFDRPWRFDDKDETTFTVVAPFNSHPGRTPIREEIEREFHKWCCFSVGVMNISVSSGTSKFRSGETIELKVNVDNKSDAYITQMHLKLVKKLTFHTSSQTKHDSEILEAVYGSETYGKKGETLLKMNVPSVHPLNLKYCSIIDVRHKLTLSTHVSGMHSKIKLEYPVNL